MNRAPSPYLLLGAVAAGERRSREMLSMSMRAATVVSWPAARGWRSPFAAPLRRRASDASAELTRDGHELVAGASTRAQAAGVEVLRHISELLGSGLADDVVHRLLSSGAFDRVVTIVINHPDTEALVGSALDEPGLERLIARVMDSRVIEHLTARVLESDEMQLVPDYVTRSPEQRAALARQTAGLAGDVAVGVRSRTVVADNAAERLARGLIRRRARIESP